MNMEIAFKKGGAFGARKMRYISLKTGSSSRAISNQSPDFSGVTCL